VEFANQKATNSGRGSRAVVRRLIDLVSLNDQVTFGARGATRPTQSLKY
jgi:hypothetical protein